MAEKNRVPGLEFNVEEITGEQVEDFLTALNDSKIRQQAAIMAQLCTSCPKEWGDPKNPETFSKLKFLTLRKARDHFMEDVADLGKNSNGAS